MRSIWICLLSLLVSLAYAGEELTDQVNVSPDNSRITEYENNNKVSTENLVEPEQPTLQEQPVRMIVGGESEDGVARKIIVAPR